MLTLRMNSLRGSELELSIPNRAEADWSRDITGGKEIKTKNQSMQRGHRTRQWVHKDVLNNLESFGNKNKKKKKKTRLDETLLHLN